VAVATAVRKPKVISVPTRSLSIVFGHADDVHAGLVAIGAAHAIVPSPPMTMIASSRSRRDRGEARRR
jgi:hypothetical protein